MEPTQPPIQPSVNIPDFQSKPNYLKTIIFSILGVSLLVVTIYLYFQNQKLQKQVLNPPVSPTIQPPAPTSTPKIVLSISIPPDETAGWKYYKDSICNLDIPIPPEKLDIDKRTWKTEIQSNYDFLGFFKGNAITLIHRNPEEASGFISGMVTVACGQNNNSLTKLNSDFHSHLTLQTPQNTIPEALIELTSNNNVTMWGIPTKEMTFVGGMFDPKQKYYLIVNSNKWYLITKKSDSLNPEINQQTNQIFDLLKFK